jgi:hypothetical protein
MNKEFKNINENKYDKNQVSNLNLNEDINSFDNIKYNYHDEFNYHNQDNNSDKLKFDKADKKSYYLDNYNDNKSSSDKYINPDLFNKDIEFNQVIKSTSDNGFENFKRNNSSQFKENINNLNKGKKNSQLDEIEREYKEKIINKELNLQNPVNLETSSFKRKKEIELALENKNSNSSLKFILKDFTTEKEELENIDKQDAYMKTKRQIKNISSYQKIEEIGEGTYGRVCKYK